MALKKETRELIDGLLVSVPIEINYKHDIFLKETKNYAQYMTSELEANRYLAGKQLNPEYKNLLADKKKITFTNIKSDIVNNAGADRLHELEERYIFNCTRLAVAADEQLGDDFKMILQIS